MKDNLDFAGPAAQCVRDRCTLRRIKWLPGRVLACGLDWRASDWERQERAGFRGAVWPWTT